MSDFIAIDILGDKELAAKLNGLPLKVGNRAVDEVSKYLINVYKTYPPFKHVARKTAYGGDGFFSDKQRRWFFAALRRGAIPTPGAKNRTQTFSQGWKQILPGQGMSSIIANETSYGPYLMDKSRRARLSKLAGWQTMEEILEQRKERINRIIEGVAKRVIG